MRHVSSGTKQFCKWENCKVNPPYNAYWLLLPSYTPPTCIHRLCVHPGLLCLLLLNVANGYYSPRLGISTVQSIDLALMWHQCWIFIAIYVTPLADEQSNATVEGNNVATVGTFVGGLVAGSVCVVLVVGIVLGLVKLRKQRKGAESVQEEMKT